MKKMLQMKGILLIVIGLMLMVLDINIPFGELYPKMGKALDLGDVFQNNVIANFIGKQASFDILSDILGLAFIFIGCIIYVKKSKKFIVAMILIPIAGALYIIIPQLPFHYELRDLYVNTAGLKFLLMILEVMIEFYVIHGIVKMTDCMQNAWHNNEMLIGWIVAMISKVFLFFIIFFAMKTMTIIYTVILIVSTIFYINRLYRTLEFDPEKQGVVNE